MKRFYLLDLHQFDGGDGGAGEGSAEAAGTAERTEGAAGEESQAAAETGEEEETEDLEREFDELAKGKYKEQFKSRMQKAIKSRLKGTENDRAELAKAAQLKSAISMRYGLNPNANTDEILSAISSDQSFLEEAAAREGLSPEQYRQMASMRQQLYTSQQQLDEAKRAQFEEQARKELDSQCSECREYFPDFDFEYEAATNEKFANLVRNGERVLDAYTYAHMNELMANGMHRAASEGAKATAAAVKNNLRRANEAGSGSHAAASVSVDFAKMSSEEFNEYQNKLMSGAL